ncbi:MAG: 50S ribosomal protein L11 methyltransferase [Candidatus Omnitrophica bacterium]|nr:50S ribosomal protein L11 methyltransferase [Candidatus Omnitrophota bacterium]
MKKNDIQYEVGVVLPMPSTACGREMVFALLSKAGYDLSRVVEQEEKTAFKVSIFWDKKAEAVRFLQQIKKWRLKKARACFIKHCRTDWSSRWKKDWKPFSLTPKLFVVPLWLKDRKIPRWKEPLYLDTTNAFGTGLHETTQLTAQFIESLSGTFKTFLDVGTGSGILVVVAKKSGAGYCAAFDIDPGAVKVALKNLKANKMFCDMLKASDIKKFFPGRKFDFVAANLVTRDLTAFRKKIISFVAPGGFLAISGISLRNMRVIKKEFFGPPLQLLKVVKGREWAGYLFRREPQ